MKVHKGHEELVQSCERRERLERTARARLQGDCRRYQELNRALREQVDLLSNQMLARSPAPDSNGPGHLRQELSKREVLIAQLITQSKMAPCKIIVCCVNWLCLQIKNLLLLRNAKKLS